MLREDAPKGVVVTGKKLRFLEKDDFEFLFKFGQSVVDVRLVVGVL